MDIVYNILIILAIYIVYIIYKNKDKCEAAISSSSDKITCYTISILNKLESVGRALV
jgi:hypothetical protein